MMERIDVVSIPLMGPEVLESHLINCIDIGGTCNCTCSSCLDTMGQCICTKCRCFTIVETMMTELYEEEPADYLIG